MQNPISLKDESVEELVVEATNDFMDRVHQGQEPNVEEFARRYPEIADILRQLLPAVHSLPRCRADVVMADSPIIDRAEPLGCLGDFQLIQEIGRGGMGIVYEAEQVSLNRKVALKVLPFAAALDAKQLQRFKNEAQAAAHLHHPHIVPVFSVGCERGVHYYAMQFIDGQPLATLIQELRQLGGRKADHEPGSAALLNSTLQGLSAANDQTTDFEMDFQPVGPFAAETLRAIDATASADRGPGYFRAAAKLGVQAAEALEHAHSFGIVHRDIKPGNLLADATGKLWITDFGLVHFQSDGGMTGTGDLVGTLRYMSPEQALAKRGLVDHCTDIYALGATLYELLTLEPVFAGKDREELLRQIAFEEPRPPRQLNQAIPADLETIVLKAMAKRVEERYATAQELADDLHRFLDQMPIRARRPTLWEKAAKWSRRHRAMVGVGAVVLLLAAVGFGVSTALITREHWQTQAAYQQVAEEQARTKEALEAEVEQRLRAEKSFRQAREAVDFLTQISEQELAGRPELQELRRKLLRAALAYYKDFIEQRGDDPSVQQELAESHMQVAGILDEIGSKAEAWAAFKRARQFEAKLPPEHFCPMPFGHGPAGIWQDSNLILLLAQKSVEEELRLAESQATMAEQFVRKRRDVQWECRGLPPEQGHARLDELAAEERTLIGELQPDQVKRLRQIALQQRDMEALSDPDVANALQLTAEQKDKVRIIHADAREPLRRPPPPTGNGRDVRKKHEKFGKPSRDDLWRVLTAEQQERWQELTGEPFKALLPPFRPPHSLAGLPR